MPDSARATPSPRPAPVTPDPPPNAGTATVDSPQAVQVVRSKKKVSTLILPLEAKLSPSAVLGLETETFRQCPLTGEGNDSEGIALFVRWDNVH